jgi:hypothetical protein
MYNFNHERWLLAIQASRLARTCVEESLSFARSRQTFGKFLIEHQVGFNVFFEKNKAYSWGFFKVDFSHLLRILDSVC